MDHYAIICYKYQWCFLFVALLSVFVTQDTNTALSTTFYSFNTDILHVIDEYGTIGSKLDNLSQTRVISDDISKSDANCMKYDMLNALQTFYVSYPLALTCTTLYQKIHPESKVLAKHTIFHSQTDVPIWSSQIIDKLYKKLTSDPIFIKLWWNISTLTIARLLNDDKYVLTNSSIIVKVNKFNEDSKDLTVDEKSQYLFNIRKQLFDEEVDFFCTFVNNGKIEMLSKAIFSLTF